jgi:hypothetical protein
VSRLACRAAAVALAALGASGSTALAAETVLVALDSPIRYRANLSDPGIGTLWTQALYNDTTWPIGSYGVGYEAAPPGASALIRTPVPAGTLSIYTRARFTVADPAAVASLFLGADWDDAYVAWINGVEVYRSPEMPGGTPAWNTNPSLHESSNGGLPNYGDLADISTAAIPALVAGENVLAIGVWNSGGASSTDLVLVPRLSLRPVSPVTRGPYLQRGSVTGMVVRWRTAAASDSRVRYGTDPLALTLVADDPTITTEHAVTLAGLAPGTRYYYSVGSSAAVQAGGDADHFLETSPATGGAGPTRIWVVGDSGTANGDARAVKDAYRSYARNDAADLMLMLGDNAYDSGTDAEYQAAVFDMYPEILRQTVLWPTFGNHDAVSADSGTGTGVYYDIFTMPTLGESGGLASGKEAYYSFDFANLHFICLDSQGSNRAPGSPMLTWLANDLLATTQDWVIAFWHHPPYSKGSHDSDLESDLTDMRQNVLPILEAGGVDLVLTGHSHSYERSFLLDGHYGTSDTLSPAMILDAGDGKVGGDGAYLKSQPQSSPHDGAVYVVAGSSGRISGGTLNHPAMLRSLNVLGSLVIDVDGPNLDVRFVDDNSELEDLFTIYKGGCATLPAAVGDSLNVSAGTAGGTAIAWSAEPGFSSWNLYRGSRGAAPFAFNHACLEAASSDPAATDAQAPAPEFLFYYLVTGRSACGEGGPGVDSAGTPRPVPSPCP